MTSRSVVNRLWVVFLAGTCSLFTGMMWGQVSATLTGSVKDASGAVIAGATVTVKHVETGLSRTVQTDANGSYTVPSIPVGQYEVTAENSGFKKEVRSGINLVVGQTGVVNFSLEVGAVEQQVTVTGEASLVNTTTSQTSGVVTEQQIKDLPLNGRSYDQLLALNANASYFSNGANGAARGGFSLSGKRYETNRWLVDGIDYIGEDATGQLVLPTGSSGDLLGVDAVREFNAQGDSYGVQYGKRAGGQISVVTTSGTNNLHGDLYEFLRNTDVDAGSFFTSNIPGAQPTTLKRNQFGGALGGPIKPDKLFYFLSYEGVRQPKSTGTISYIPDTQARFGILPCGTSLGPACATGVAKGALTTVPGLNPGMLPLVQIAWPDPATVPGGCQEQIQGGVPTGVCGYITAPPQRVREDYSLGRFDYNISSTDTFATTYIYDNGITQTAGAIPIAGSESPLATQMLSIRETHVFSPSLLNVATIGFSRAYASSRPSPYMLFNGPQAPIPGIAYFVQGGPHPAVGGITVGGGTSGAAGSNSTVSAGLGSTSGPLTNVRNLFTWSDDVTYTKGSHSISMGVWVQRDQINSTASPANSSGGATFSSIQTLLQGTVSSFLVVPDATEMGYRSTEYAYYWQDDVKLKHNLDVRVGIRMEGDTGYNEWTGRAANYGFTGGVVNTFPTIGYSPFVANNSTALWQPRVGLAWDPNGNGKWSVRASFGIYNDLQDNMNHRLTANPPFNTRLTFTNGNFLSEIPINAAAPLSPQCTAAVVASNTNACAIPEIAGVDPNAHTPTTQQWNFSIERELAKDLLVHIGYVGMEAYHTIVLTDANQVVPQVCNNPNGCVSGGINTGATLRGVVPSGTYYLPLSVDTAGVLGTPGAPDGCRTNCDINDTQIWMFDGTQSYHGLSAFIQKRFSKGFQFRANYTFSKVLDLNSGLLSSEASNEQQDLYNFYNQKLSKGPAAFDLRHQFNFNFSAELPFGRDRALLKNAGRVVDVVLGGWQVNGILGVQTGFPFTPEAGNTITGNGDTHAVDLPNVNPNFSGPLYSSRSITQYFNPAAFLEPLPGTYGNAGRGQYTEPGLINMDMSIFKKFAITEHKNLEFRAEAFNLANHPNLGRPNPNVFNSTGTAISPTAGTITNLAGTNRQIQFGLKFLF
jgi:hypothetical protein